jgi:hypothetical protein
MNKLINALLVICGLFLATVAVAGPSILSVYQGGTGLNAVAVHQVFVGTASNIFTAKTIPDCPDSGGNHINFTQSGDSISCGTSGSGGSTFSPTSSVHLYDEFCGGTTTSGQIGELGWLGNTNGSGGLFRYTNTAAVNQTDHPCLIYINSAAASTWEWMVLSNINSANSSFTGLDSRVWTIQASVSDGIDSGANKFDNTSTFGFVANTGTSTPGNGIYFQCISPASPTTVNFQDITADGGGTTQNDSGVACNNNFNFHDLKITSDGAGTIKFYIDGTNVSTQTTHVFTGKLNPAFGILDTNSSTNAHQYGIDFFNLDLTLSR